MSFVGFASELIKRVQPSIRTADPALPLRELWLIEAPAAATRGGEWV